MNRVLFTLSALALLAVSLLPFVHFAPNRFLGGQGQSLWSIFRLADPTLSVLLIALLAGGVGLMWLSLKGQGYPQRHVITAVVSCMTAAVAFAVLAVASKQLIAQASPAARVTIGSGFWVLFLLLNLILIDVWQRLQLPIPLPTSPQAPQRGRTWVALLIVGMVVGLTLAFMLQAFDALSLVKEYRNHQARFIEALYRHIQLVIMAFIPTLLLGLLLGGLVWLIPRCNAVFFSVLNFLQTIPSIALFALLMMPLSWLAIKYPTLQTWGISGIGAAPSVIALVLYTLLPLARNTYAGLSSVPYDAREAATAMGMSRLQIFRDILLPLSLPMILSGVRIVIVQLIGLTVVAALIGAGGLGIFVWEGLGQYALDLVLLGALPTIVLALLADWGVQALIRRVQPITSAQPLVHQEKLK